MTDGKTCKGTGILVASPSPSPSFTSRHIPISDTSGKNDPELCLVNNVSFHNLRLSRKTIAKTIDRRGEKYDMVNSD